MSKCPFFKRGQRKKEIHKAKVTKDGSMVECKHFAKGLGVFSILNQINLTKLHNKQYLYLGYQIDSCQKMNYKNKYYPYQELIENRWVTTNK